MKEALNVNEINEQTIVIMQETIDSLCDKTILPLIEENKMLKSKLEKMETKKTYEVIISWDCWYNDGSYNCRMIAGDIDLINTSSYLTEDGYSKELQYLYNCDPFIYIRFN